MNRQKGHLINIDDGYDVKKMVSYILEVMDPDLLIRKYAIERQLLAGLSYKLRFMWE